MSTFIHAQQAVAAAGAKNFQEYAKTLNVAAPKMAATPSTDPTDPTAPTEPAKPLKTKAK